MINSNRGVATAHRLRKELKIDFNSRVDLIEVANQLSIKIKYHDLGPGIDGACKSVGLNRLVVLKPNPTNQKKERFTLAHEIGHLLIHHASFLCESDAFSFFRTYNNEEQEANEFAAEFLLPSQACHDVLGKTDLEFSIIAQISEKFDTSLAVAAIKLTKLFGDNAAILLHDGKKIKWAVKSESCDFNLLKIVPDMALAHRANKNERSVKGNIDPAVWIENDSENLICEEETNYFVKYKDYMTVLKFYED